MQDGFAAISAVGVAAGQQFGFCYPDPAFIPARLNLRDWNKHLNFTLATEWRCVNQGDGSVPSTPTSISNALGTYLFNPKRHDKKKPMPEPLNPKERQVLDLLIQHVGGINRPVHYSELRKAGFPERVAEIYGDRSEYLDSLSNRKLQILRNKGWITMNDAVNTVVCDPSSG
jgi:hypothetical protein